jgi:hypothetical protein
MDERWVLHRYKSTSHAAVAAGIMIGGWFLYELYARGNFRKDLFIILLVTAGVKLVALTWYKLRD